ARKALMVMVRVVMARDSIKRTPAAAQGQSARKGHGSRGSETNRRRDLPLCQSLPLIWNSNSLVVPDSTFRLSVLFAPHSAGMYSTSDGSYAPMSPAPSSFFLYFW